MKRTISWILTVAMILGLMAIVPLSVSADDPATIGTVEAGYTPTGTPITSEAEFAAMAADGNYYLANDISITASYATAFTGTFDGNGKTVNTNVPMFLTFNGNIKNLTVTGALESSERYLGAIAARCRAASTYENILNKATVTSTVPKATDSKSTDSSVGGLVGRVDTGASTFINCSNEADIYSSEAAGGLVGESQILGTTFINCSNSGKITGISEDSGAAAGGIYGYSGSDGTIATNCMNYGEIISGRAAGGIVGDARKGITITGCHNYGKVTAKATGEDKVGRAGGMVGYSGDSGTTKLTSIINCFNTADIYGDNQVGGFVGYVYGKGPGSNCFAVIKNSVNVGNVSGETFVSPFIGYTNSVETTIMNSVSAGTITPVDTANKAYPEVIVAVFGCSSAPVYGCNIQNAVIVDGGATKWYTWAAYATDEVNAASRIPLEAILSRSPDGYAYTYDKYDENYTVTEAAVANTLASTDAYKIRMNEKSLTRATALTQEVLDVANAGLGGPFFKLSVTGEVEYKTDFAVSLVTGEGVVSACDSVAAAFAAATDGSTINLYADATISEAIVVDKAVSLTINGNGNTLSYTGEAPFALSFKTPASTISIDNLKLESAKGGIILRSNADEASKSVLNIKDSEITTTGGVGIQYLQYWDINADTIKVTTSSHGIQATTYTAVETDKDEAVGNNHVVVKNATIDAKGYGIYLRLNSTLDLSNSTLTVTNSGIQMITAYTPEQGSVSRLKNVNITGTKAYCVVTNPYNKVYIDGGVYKSTTKDAAINISGIYAYGEIKSGTFECDQNCAARAYRNGSAKAADGTSAYTYLTDGSDHATLDIYGGTFTYTAASAGSAIRGGTGDQPGTINIFGGTFITKAGTGAVVNGANAGNITNIYAGTFTNEGENIVAVFAKTGTTGTEAIAFNDGTKTLTIESPEYTITWNVEGVTTTSTVKAGQIPAFAGTPERTSTEPFHISVFTGWDTEIVRATGDATYTAQFVDELIKYTITWDVNGTTTTTQVEHGTVPVFSGSTDKADDEANTYTFTGWDKEIVAATADATYTAQYTSALKKYTITWVAGGTTTTTEVEHGTVPSFTGTTDKAEDEVFIYTFTGWDKEFVAATADVTYTALYSTTPKGGDFVVTSSTGSAKVYATIEAAIAAIVDGDTLSIAADVTLAAPVVVEKTGIKFTINGGNFNIEYTGANYAFVFKTPSSTVSIENFKLTSAKGGIILRSNADAASKSVFNIKNSEITSNGGVGIHYLQYWDLNIDTIKVTASSNGIQATTYTADTADTDEAVGNNNLVVKNVTVEAKNGYGIYLRMYSTLDLSDSTITTTANPGVQMITSYAKETGSVSTLKNVNITSTNAYCIVTNPFNKVYIDGGEYKATNKDACINISGIYAYGEIKSGTFECDKNCAARAYRNDGAKAADGVSAYTYMTDGSDNATLDILGGTFIFTAETSGSAIRGGTGAQPGTVNISGGTFITKAGTGAVVNGVHAGNITNITGGTFINEGTNDIKVFEKTGTTGHETISFPAGIKTFTYAKYTVTWSVNGTDTTAEYLFGSMPAFEGSTDKAEDADNTYTFTGWDKELAIVTADVKYTAQYSSTPKASDTTTEAPDDTTTEAPDDTTTAAPGGDDTTAAPGGDDTTAAPVEDGCGGCGGIAVFAQIIAIVCGIFAFAIIKRK